MLRIKLKLRTGLWILLSVEDLTLNKSMSKRHEIQPENRFSDSLLQKEGCKQRWYCVSGFGSTVKPEK